MKFNAQEWLLAEDHTTPSETPHEKKSWWKVMCLTGVDYFSTLGYQPGIAALAAGLLSPLATVVLIVLTLAGALPVYRRVAAESPRGEGSINMLERFLPWWGGKLVVLVLLGFAATDFTITMTLSAADAAEHLVDNPLTPHIWTHHKVLVTLILLALLGGVFLRGFSEAIGIAVVLTGSYLILNAIVIGDAMYRIFTADNLIFDKWNLLYSQHSNPLMMIAIALVVFPKLALGLSGFETGVAVMPQIKGDPGDSEANLTGRIRGAKRLLTTAAITMSVFLITSSIVTTVLIPQNEFQQGGHANGRALAYLAHQNLGAAFGSAYDISTILILWFAGASAMAGLLNLVPRYLPRYGMAPEWLRATRPMVLLFTAVAFVVTIYFRASVDAQGGAYATGVLVLITSAAFAVTLSARRANQTSRVILFGVVTVVFIYTTITNIIERPDGVRIAALFILAIIAFSLISRIHRSFELRVTDITFDDKARKIIDYAASNGTISIVSHDTDDLSTDDYLAKELKQRAFSHIPEWDTVVFLEVNVRDASEFNTELRVHGRQKGPYRILWTDSPVVGNAIAAILLDIRNKTGIVPDVYFEWSEGNPIINFLKFLWVGQGEVANVTREVLRRHESDYENRPHVHVG